MDWNYFKIRRRTTLERFLSNASSEAEALEILSKKGLTNLPLEEIKLLFAAKQTSVEQVSTDTSTVEVSKEEVSLDTALPTKTKVTSGTTGS